MDPGPIMIRGKRAGLPEPGDYPGNPCGTGKPEPRRINSAVPENAGTWVFIKLKF